MVFVRCPEPRCIMANQQPLEAPCRSIHLNRHIIATNEVKPRSQTAKQSYSTLLVVTPDGLCRTRTGDLLFMRQQL